MSPTALATPSAPPVQPARSAALDITGDATHYVCHAIANFMGTEDLRRIVLIVTKRAVDEHTPIGARDDDCFSSWMIPPLPALPQEGMPPLPR
jgi:hypothetical protein